jgi:hypothetical protein
MLVVWVRLFSDGFRLIIEVVDQAPGVPVEGKAAADDECGRGLPLVDAFTDGHWGWLLGPPGKCVGRTESRRQRLGNESSGVNSRCYRRTGLIRSQ